MYMSKERTTVTKLMLFNDDGDELEPETEKLVYQLMKTFKSVNVSGRVPIEVLTDVQAMRMAVAIMNEWRITSMDRRSEVPLLDGSDRCESCNKLHRYKCDCK